MNCINCSKEFEGRADAKFCSDKCRKQHARKSDKPDQVSEITNRSDTDELFRADAEARGLGEDYYTLTDRERTVNCLQCGRQLSTFMPILRQCSPLCMRSMLNSLTK